MWLFVPLQCLGESGVVNSSVVLGLVWSLDLDSCGGALSGRSLLFSVNKYTITFIIHQRVADELLCKTFKFLYTLSANGNQSQPRVAQVALGWLRYRSYCCVFRLQAVALVLAGVAALVAAAGGIEFP